MLGTISTDSVQEAVLHYIASHHPLVECLELSMLKLDETWLVQVDTVGEDEAVQRLVFVVTSSGIVQEATGSVSRQSAQRCLAGLKTSTVVESH